MNALTAPADVSLFQTPWKRSKPFNPWNFIATFDTMNRSIAATVLACDPSP